MITFRNYGGDSGDRVTAETDIENDSFSAYMLSKHRIWLAASAGAKHILPGGSPDPRKYTDGM